MGSLSILQGIFPTQETNPGLPHYRRILYQLSHKGSPPKASYFLASFLFLLSFFSTSRSTWGCPQLWPPHSATVPQDTHGAPGVGSGLEPGGAREASVLLRGSFRLIWSSPVSKHFWLVPGQDSGHRFTEGVMGDPVACGSSHHDNWEKQSHVFIFAAIPAPLRQRWYSVGQRMLAYVLFWGLCGCVCLSL